MSRIVADACTLITYHVPQARSGQVAAVLEAADEILAPDWALAECANALWKNVLAGKCSVETGLEFLDAITNADIDYQSAAPLLPHALELAALFRHPVYDCLYLALAMVEEAPVVTTDRRLAKTAVDAGLGDLVVLVEGD